ncbi:MAG: DUF3465 domain-containing protein [Candidatus Woykebacteria bacterium]
MSVEQAFQKRVSNTSVTAKGKISRILEDDSGETPHQRFVVEVHSGHTVLVAHNLERAYRVPVNLGDKVEIHGTYVWNKFGGIIHNTHHDDREACRKVINGRVVCGPSHEDGWIIFVGKKKPAS